MGEVFIYCTPRGWLLTAESGNSCLGVLRRHCMTYNDNYNVTLADFKFNIYVVSTITFGNIPIIVL